MKSSFFFTVVYSLFLLSNLEQYLCTTLPLNSITDKNALLTFKNTITSDPNATLSNNWSTNTSVCNWIGVSCGNKHQRIISLNISGFALSGTLSPHLGNLTFLRSLDMSSNDFTGPIPSELSRLYRLRAIYIETNSFTGDLPSWLGALPQLKILSLGNNTFSGTIPPSLFNSSKLQQLDMSYNSISGPIPEEIGNCSSLQMVELDDNQLTGNIPYTIFNLSSIIEIWIMDNGLSGSLPSDMCNNLPSLTTLAISFNQIEGQIPSNIWKCRELEIISLSYNRFNGEIPSEVGNLTMLEELFLGENDLQGEIPQEFANLMFLEILNMHNNSMSGSIPSSIFNISTLKVLDLSWNHFSGNVYIPISFSLFNLEELYLVYNGLSGEFPKSITNASKLTVLDLSENSFNGFIPNFGSLRLLSILDLVNNNLSGNQELNFLSSLTNCQHLDYIGISGNQLNGILPSSIGNLSKSLQQFHAENSNINGVIPSTIGNLSSLLYLFLERNQLTGFIPPTIWKLKRLQKLSLSMNQLRGNIPPDLCRLSNIGEMYLNDNILTGRIPDCLGDVKSLRVINLGSNKLNSNIPSSFWNLKDILFLNLSSNYLSGRLSPRVASFKVINQLDLSRNKLSGEIPSSIDGCQTLGFLSLSNNKFEGFIPPSLGNMRSLITLDLSDNNLSGTMPESLGNLSLLKYLNVSYNKLEGEIPTVGPFGNFTAQSFFNNSALCGETKFHVPPCARKDVKKSRLKRVERIMKYIFAPFFSIIIFATIVVLVIMMRRRKLKRSAPAPTDDISLGVSWRRISYIELVRGTNEFSETNLLGTGGFGSVFKATLSDGLNIAVKVYNLESERVVRSFDTECEVLSNVRHRNLVQIIGCCANKEFKALILEYMPNGSLEKWLHSESYCLDLIQRLQIAIDIASALEYLHHGHTFPIVHCDIKPSNVLLDEEMVAHLGDFGISKLFDDGETMVQTKTLATIGYAAPEYGSEGKVSTNGDVYSYGILLLEIFTSKKPTDDMFSDEMSLKDWVHKAVQENAITEVLALDLLTRDDQMECVSSILSLAMKCLVVSPDERINMIETVATLQRIKAKV